MVKDNVPDDRHRNRLIGNSPALTEVLDQIARVAPLNRSVLIVGERGTGKELVAERLHHLSNRWAAPFLKTNCAAISESLLESDLFGHEAGAFTGAVKTRQGRFERADGGTLFLDELSSVSPQVQDKLLRIIEYGEFERLGAQRTQKVDVRLLAATNEDLQALAAAGEFRADLLDRLAFDVITLPPLRHRREDILTLAEHFGIAMAQELGLPSFPGLAPEARRQLLAYSWPGNVRELKNAVERSLYRCPTLAGQIAEIHLDPFASPYKPKRQRSEGKIQMHPNRDSDSEAPAIARDEQRDSPSPQGHRDRTPADVQLPLDFKRNSAAFEIGMLQAGLRAAKFNQKRAADLLGLTYNQLRGHLKKHRLSQQSNDLQGP